MKTYKTILLFLFSICSLPAFAQGLTLDTILTRIEKNNPMLSMYDEQIKASKEFAAGAKSWMPPSLSMGLWQTPYQRIGDGMLMITGEQMIPNPRKQNANLNYMLGMASVEAEGKAATRNELFALAKENYYAWIVLKKKYDALVQFDSLLTYISQVAQLRYTYNREKLNNIYKAQADLYELRNMETMVVSDMKMKSVLLQTLMITNNYMPLNIDTTLTPKDYEVVLPDTSLISSSRSDIRQFDAYIALVRLQQQYEQSKRLPEFGASISHMKSLGAMPNQFSAMGMVTIPIAPWARKEYTANLKGLDNTASAIDFQKQALINESLGMITSIQSQILYTKQQLSNYRENIIPSYLKSYQSSMIAYEQNTEDLFVVLDALKMYRMAKISELDQLNILLKLQVSYEKELEIR